MTHDPTLLERVDRAVDRAALIRLTQDLVRIRSYSAGGEEGTLARWVQAHMQDLGLESRLQEVQPGRFNVISRLPGQQPNAADAHSLMFNGHLDTNPAGEGWTRDPLGGEVDERFIYGIGVSNMKAADAAYIAAVAAVRRAGITLRADVLVAHVIGELQGGVGTVHMLRDGVRADRFVVGEPTDLDLVTMHAGSMECQLTVFGMTRHLSKAEEAVDALAIMIEAVAILKEMPFTGPDTPSHRAVRRVGIGVMRAGLGPDFLEWRPSLMADRAMIRFSPRYGPGQTPQGVMADIEAALTPLRARHPGARLELVRNESGQRQQMGPFAVAPDADIVRTVAEAHGAVRGTAPRTGAVGPARFYGTDAAHLADAGMVGVVYGPGGRYNTMPDERVDLPDLVDAARVYARVIVQTCR